MPEPLALNAAEFPRCCDRCFHSPERPCRDLVACLESGPLCHEDDACAAKLTARREAAMRLTGGNAVGYVGTGTSGLGAGAAKTLPGTAPGSTSMVTRRRSSRSAASASAPTSRSSTCSCPAVPA